MTKYRTDMQRLAYQVLSEDMKNHEVTKEFAFALMATAQEVNSLPPYSNNVTYNEGDWVSFKFQTYECQYDNTSGEMPVVDNQLNTDINGNLLWKVVDHRTIDQLQEWVRFRQAFSAQKIYLEHYLNAVLNNNSIDPWSKTAYLASGKDIYIENTADREYTYIFSKQAWPLLPEDEVYLHDKWNSSTDYAPGDMVAYEDGKIYQANSNDPAAGESPASHPSKWDYVAENHYVFDKSYYQVDPHFIVWVPVEVKNSLPSGTWEGIVRSHVDRYNMATRKYNVKTY